VIPATSSASRTRLSSGENIGSVGSPRTPEECEREDSNLQGVP
jgi:hypothetical protein